MAEIFRIQDTYLDPVNDNVFDIGHASIQFRHFYQKGNLYLGILAQDLTIADAINFILNTTTGTKIGTATDQKLGFFNAAPVVQQGATIDLGVVLSNLGLRAAGTAYPITTSGDITHSGDLFWTGDGSGVPYGSCYGNEIGWTQATAVQSTWYNIADTDMTDGELNLITHDGSGKLTVTKAGRYLINYSVSTFCSANNAHVETGIEISGSGSANNAGICSWYPQTANAEGVQSGTAIIDLAANATIEICIKTEDAGTPTLGVNHLNITVQMVGGT